MTLKPISATELRTRTREIMQRAKFMHETFLVENFGAPMVVIVGVDEYQELLTSHWQSESEAESGNWTTQDVSTQG
jgi:PHD/YefM family antitoxin component YafN of YafNO toxin-antitoxin module